ncbi:MAG TPA: hypothetical protein VFQ39_20430 [Longimicrobium sp.]|nr:hypothetical protein [Longimicrobium sp.]
MKTIRIALPLLAAALVLGAAGDAQRVGRVCPDPARPCAGFQPHELSFVLPADSVARAEIRSDRFWAVIVRSAPRCSIAERDRAALQAHFPREKVFSQRFECEDENESENIVTYTNVNPNAAFLAVYGGETRDRAEAVLRRVEALRRYPGANVRRMQAVRVSP